MSVAIFSLVLFIYAVMSWFPSATSSNFYIELDKFFSKLLEPIRKAIPAIGGKIDISPLILIVVVNIGAQLVIVVLDKLGL